MINVLVSAVGDVMGQGVLKALRISSYPLHIVGTDIVPHVAGLFMCDKGYLVTPVVQNKDQYIKEFIELCKKEKIDIAFICHAEEQYVIASHLQEMQKEVNTYFVVQPIEVLSLCRNKLLTYEFLSKQNVRVPETYAAKEDAKKLIAKYGFPILVKPRQSSGSRNVFVIHNKKELDAAWQQAPGAIVQEYIANKDQEEYTVGIFLDKQSKSMGAIAMLRELKDGNTSFVIVDDYPDVMNVGVKAAESIRAIGPCNVQLRKDRNNQPCVIEINARVSGTAVFRAKFGFNEIEACIDYFLKKKRPHLSYSKGVAFRTFSELYIPTEKYTMLKENKEITNESI